MEHSGRRGNYFAYPVGMAAQRAYRVERMDLFLHGHSGAAA